MLSKWKFETCYLFPLNSRKHALPNFGDSSLRFFKNALISRPKLYGFWFKASKERNEQILCAMKDSVVTSDDYIASLQELFHEVTIWKNIRHLLSLNGSRKCWKLFSFHQTSRWEQLSQKITYQISKDHRGNKKLFIASLGLAALDWALTRLATNLWMKAEKTRKRRHTLRRKYVREEQDYHETC